MTLSWFENFTCSYSTTQKAYFIQRCKWAHFDSTSRVHHCIFTETWDCTIVINGLSIYRETCRLITMHYTSSFQPQYFTDVAFAWCTLSAFHAFSNKYCKHMVPLFKFSHSFPHTLNNPAKVLLTKSSEPISLVNHVYNKHLSKCSYYIIGTLGLIILMGLSLQNLMKHFLCLYLSPILVRSTWCSMYPMHNIKHVFNSVTIQYIGQIIFLHAIWTSQLVILT